VVRRLRHVHIVIVVRPERTQNGHGATTGSWYHPIAGGMLDDLPHDLLFFVLTAMQGDILCIMRTFSTCHALASVAAHTRAELNARIRSSLISRTRALQRREIIGRLRPLDYWINPYTRQKFIRPKFSTELEFFIKIEYERRKTTKVVFSFVFTSSSCWAEVSCPHCNYTTSHSPKEGFRCCSGADTRFPRCPDYYIQAPEDPEQRRLIALGLEWDKANQKAAEDAMENGTMPFTDVPRPW